MRVVGYIAVFFGFMLAAVSIFLLAFCEPGPHLGSYRFENARLVDAAAFAAIEPHHPVQDASANFIRIEFTSDQDLETASGGSGSGLYLKADFCPLRDDYRIWAIGPYYNDRSPYRLLNRRERPLPGGGTAIEGDQIHPSRDPRTGRYLYTGYIVPWHPARRGAQGEAREAYDLRTDNRDLCLRIDHSGYYRSRSQSDVFVIPGAAIAAALRQAPSPRR